MVEACSPISQARSSRLDLEGVFYPGQKRVDAVTPIEGPSFHAPPSAPPPGEPSTACRRAPCQPKLWRGAIPGTYIPRRAYNSYRTRARGERFEELLRVDEQVALRAKGIVNGTSDKEESINAFKLGSETDTPSGRFKAHMTNSFSVGGTSQGDLLSRSGRHSTIESDILYDENKRNVFVHAITSPIVGMDLTGSLTNQKIRAGCGSLWHMGMRSAMTSFTDDPSIVGIRCSKFSEILQDPYWLRYFLNSRDSASSRVPSSLSLPLFPNVESSSVVFGNDHLDSRDGSDSPALVELYSEMIRYERSFVHLWNVRVQEVLRRESFYLGSSLVGESSSLNMQSIVVKELQPHVKDRIEHCILALRLLQFLTHSPAYSLFTKDDRKTFFTNLVAVVDGSNSGNRSIQLVLSAVLRRASRWLTKRCSRAPSKTRKTLSVVLRSYLAEKFIRSVRFLLCAQLDTGSDKLSLPEIEDAIGSRLFENCKLSLLEIKKDNRSEQNLSIREVMRVVIQKGQAMLEEVTEEQHHNSVEFLFDGEFCAKMIESAVCKLDSPSTSSLLQMMLGDEVFLDDMSAHMIHLRGCLPNVLSLIPGSYLHRAIVSVDDFFACVSPVINFGTRGKSSASQWLWKPSDPSKADESSRAGEFMQCRYDGTSMGHCMINGSCDESEEEADQQHTTPLSLCEMGFNSTGSSCPTDTSPQELYDQIYRSLKDSNKVSSNVMIWGLSRHCRRLVHALAKHYGFTSECKDQFGLLIFAAFELSHRTSLFVQR
eukprot:GHVH01009917.1.p1 GENE.GHVH01009917.1~~GHVH01009917.1.p1  ORF type:complete len:767 (+),score=97.40 GHVH01009917.1:1803-4103(+)